MHALPTFLIGAALTPALLAQPVLLRKQDGAAAGDNYGRSVANVGDIDGDFIDDYAIGADGDDTTDRDAGAVTVYSGATGAQIYQWLGNSIGDFFGYSIDAAGDVNGDGVPDVVIGAYGDDPNNLLDAGAAYVYSGATGTLIWTFLGTGLEDRSGFSVAGAGDCNRDGFDDVIVGAWSSDAGASDGGEAVVYSGRDGTVMHRFTGAVLQSYYGFSVSGAGDVNDDGYDDVIVGAPGVSVNGSRAGAGLVFSGFDGQLLFQVDGAEPVQFAGVSVAGLGDVDQDGYDDVGVGIPFSNAAGAAFGEVLVVSGQTQQVIHSLRGLNSVTLFGYDVEGRADVDNDGTPDIVVGAVTDTDTVPVSGSVFVFSGQSGNLIQRIGGQAIADTFGTSVDLGDFDGDGYADVMASAILDDTAGMDAGSASIFDVGGSDTPPRASIYGAPCMGTAGLLRIGYTGRTALGENVAVTLHNARSNSLATLNLARRANADLTSFGLTGCTLYATADGFIWLGTTDGIGDLSTPDFPVPNAPSILGLPIIAQWAMPDAGANPANIVLSDAIEFRFGQ